MTSSSAPSEPNLVVSTDIYGHHIKLEERIEIWRTCNRDRTLRLVAKMLAHLDYSMLTNGWSVIEQAWAKSAPGHAGVKIRNHLEKGHFALPPFSMVQCLKEIVLYADPTGGGNISSDGFAKCVLGISEDVDLRSMGNPESWADLHDHFTLFAIAESSATHSATIATLAPDAYDIWYRPWPPNTEPGLVDDLGSGPADVFKDVMEIGIDDFFGLGLLIYRNFEQSKESVIPKTFFSDCKIPVEVKKFFIEHCTLTMEELEGRLRNEAASEEINPWSRYILQQRPFLVREDGSVLILRLQYALQRFFSDHPFQETKWLLSQSSKEGKKRGDHFAGAMRHIFEYRVGEVLHRIADRGGASGGGVVISDPDFKEAWGTSRGQNEEICDWGYYQKGRLLLIDANMRNLLQGLAEGTADIGALNEDLAKKYRKKFSQLISTIKQFRERGWNDTRVPVDGDTKFIPLVLAPDEGLAINPMTQIKILEIAMPMVADLNGSSLPPGILSWRELLMLEAAIELCGVNFVDVLIRWRLDGSDGSKVATSLQQFLEEQPGYLGLFTERHRKMATLFFNRLQKHTFGWTLEGLSDTEKRREINKFKAFTGQEW